MKILKRKWQSYQTKIETFNASHPAHPLPDSPTFEEIKQYNLEHVFWNIGSLMHPDEMWAVDESVQQGVQVWLILQRCDEQLRRDAREVRQLLQAAVRTKAQLDELADLNEQGMSFQCCLCCNNDR